MSLCNAEADRVADEIIKMLDEMPPASIKVVLGKWKSRIESIKTQLDFVNKSLSDVTCPAAREIRTLEKCIKEIEAAWAVEKGDGVKALRILLNE